MAADLTAHRHELRERHRLKLAVLLDLEVVRRQVLDDAVVAIGDDGVDTDGVHADAEAGDVRLIGGLLDRADAGGHQ